MSATVLFVYLNIQISLQKNNFYHDAKKININSLHIKIIENSNLAYTNYKSGYIDIIDDLPISEIGTLKFSKEYKSTPLYGLYYYNFNLRLDCFKNPKTRLAISKSIDKEAITKTIRKSNELVANQYIHPNILKNKNSDNNIINYDVLTAKKLLSEAGYSSKNKFPTIEIYFNSESNNKIIAEAIQEMLKNNLGINVELRSHEWAIFNSKRKNLKYNGLAKNSHIFEYFDSSSFLKIFDKTSENQSGYQNQNYSIIFNKIPKISGFQNQNQDIINSKILDACEFLEKDAPIIPLFFYSNSSLIKPHIKNYYINSIGYKYFALIKIL